MSVAVRQKQDATQKMLKKADGDIRKFASCLENAKAGSSIKGRQDCFEALQTLAEELRQQRDQVRMLSTKSGKHNSSKCELADTRQRIEHEMKKFEEFLKGIAESASLDCVDSADHPSATKSELSAGEHISEIKVAVDQVLLEGGIDADLLSEFTCKVCLTHFVGCGPVLTRCAHLFCGDCIAEWFKMQPGNKTWAQRAQGGGTVPCPTCKEPLRKEDLHAVCRDGDGSHESKVLYEMLSSTRIVCAKNPKFGESCNCNWIGDYGSYQDHVRCCTNLPIYDCLASIQPLQEALQEASDSKEAGSPVTELPPTTAPGSAHSESECSLCDVAEDPGSVESNLFPLAETVPMEAVEQKNALGCSSSTDGQWTRLVEALNELKAKEHDESLIDVFEDMCSEPESDQAQSVDSVEEEMSDHCSGGAQTPPLPHRLLKATPGQDEATLAAHAAELHAKNRQWQEAQHKARLHLEDAYNLRLAVSQQQAAMQWQASMQWQTMQWRQAQYEAAEMMQWQHANQRTADNEAFFRQQVAQQKAATKPSGGKKQKPGASNRKAV